MALWLVFALGLKGEKHMNIGIAARPTGRAEKGMSKQSAMTKYRVIFIIALFVGAALEGTAYLYVNSSASASSPETPIVITPVPGETGSFVPIVTPTDLVTPSPAPALFTVSNLTVIPFEVGAGQPVNVSVSVANVGDIGGSLTLNLTVNGTAGQAKTITVNGKGVQTVQFSTTQDAEGAYTVVVGDQTGTFSVKATPPPPLPPGLKVSNIITNPMEGWPDQPIDVKFDLSNTGTEDVVDYPLPVAINGVQFTTVTVSVAAGATQNFTATVNGTELGKYDISIIGYGGVSFNLVPTGKHTFHYIANRADFPFTLDGVEHKSMYKELIDVGPHTVVAPVTVLQAVPTWGNTLFTFVTWDDGSTSLSRTIDIQKETYAVAYYSRKGSCPALYVWNGTAFSYEAEVSDGTGWLGYVDHFNADGTIKFSYNYPTDYVKIDTPMQPNKNGYLAMNIMETSDEIFYLDSATLIAIDHPANVDVFSTSSTYLYNLTGMGTMYTVSKNPASPISAVDSNGQNVLPQISKTDGISTEGARWQWSHLDLDLGDLARASGIKLIVTATINWPTTSQGGTNFMAYANKPGVTPSPPPYMEVKDAYGNWVRVPDNRQFPLPDVTPETFVVNLTGLFPTNNYELRINTYQNITFDYIAVDTSPQQNIVTHRINPSSADFEQAFWTASNSTGAFTRYGDVASLVQSDDNQFVIGHEGDGIALQFPDNLAPPTNGMVRDYFLVSSVWFKGTGLPYLPFTVDPLPFHGMSSFPYAVNETYPYTAENLQYIAEYNTRVIDQPTMLP